MMTLVSHLIGSQRTASFLCGLILFLALWSPPQAFAHDFHATLAEVQYNPQTRSLEVSLRLFTDDLEKALDTMYPSQGPFRLNEADVYLSAYLKEHFQAYTSGKQLLELQYVGQEVAVDVTWLYFEFPCGDQPPTRVVNSVLTELYDDQKNLVNLTYQGNKQSYVLTKGETVASLR
ncbi:hypothetical protein SAMN05421823_108172 [Catalinimonas alkaloidigena]|uniref:Orphan protein n=1 Tax=Catalinimonas alkaloidigena TaxID=1075417 RepID=A0A1G9N505_9BACT|nr:DUF6702 family protein [Catalinimonas alkaloidigena]SDL81197.1 hypothetical protein SAMN05421823_108172 [Catalinimonas alkaloidigena]